MEIGALKINNFQKFLGDYFDNRLTFELSCVRVMQTRVNILV